MAAESTGTTGTVKRVKKTALRTVVVTLIVANILIILPGAVFSVILGDYVPIIIILTLSLLGWTAAYLVIRALGSVRAGHRDKRGGQD